MISAFDMMELRWEERFTVLLNVYFATILSKNLQKSSAIQNNSITLSSVIIAIIVLYFFVIEHYKGTTIFANHQFYRQLEFVELTLNRTIVKVLLAVM